MIYVEKDPAETTSPTLIITVAEHEWYFWRVGWKIKALYYKDEFYERYPRA